MLLEEHLEELRKRLLHVIVWTALLSVAGLAAAPKALQLLTSLFPFPLVALSPTEALVTEIRIGILTGVVLASPVIIYHGLRFVMPGLTAKERQGVWLIMPAALLLAVMGVVFSVFILLNIGMLFLASTATSLGIQNMWSVAKFVSLVVSTSLIMAVVFQLPLVMLMLKKLGIISPETIAKRRRETYVAIMVIAAIITPPDAVTLALVSIPLILLFEASVAITRMSR